MSFLENPILSTLLALVVGTFIPMLLAAYLPNTTVKKFGVKAGKKFSAKGNKFAGDAYEKLENNLLGTLTAFTNGFIEGADSDDNPA